MLNVPARPHAPKPVSITPVPLLLERLYELYETGRAGWDEVCFSAADERGLGLALEAGLVVESAELPGPGGRASYDVELTPAGHATLERARSRRPLPAGYIACACGLAHSPEAWRKLPLVNVIDDGVGGRLELRNCPCGSTRARQLEELRPLAKCASASPPLPAPAVHSSSELEAAS